MSLATGHGQGGEGENKKVALLISALALLLAIAETFGKSAQTDALRYYVEASNTWAFFQAKTMRKTTLETAAEQMQIDAELARDPSVKQLLERRVSAWKDRAARYENDPQTGEGRQELMAKAKALEARTAHALATYHSFEYGSAALQIAIVLASAYIITGVMHLLWGAGALGVIGLVFSVLGFAAPYAAALGAH